MVDDNSSLRNEGKDDHFALIGFLVTIGVIGISGIIAALLVFLEN